MEGAGAHVSEHAAASVWAMEGYFMVRCLAVVLVLIYEMFPSLRAKAWMCTKPGTGTRRLSNAESPESYLMDQPACTSRLDQLRSEFW